MPRKSCVRFIPFSLCFVEGAGHVVQPSTDPASFRLSVLRVGITWNTGLVEAVVDIRLERFGFLNAS
jgi:hypothetical protein